MKKILLAIAVAISSSFATAQSYDPFVEGLINQANLDSLSKYVNELSGEIPVVVNGSTVTIQHRISWSGNDLAADYLVQKLEGLGLPVTDQSFNTEGRNIFAVQEGTEFPDEKYIICAHYDATANYCADDNASGTAAVLEAARLLSQEEFPYTIVYALWDEEEVGLYGSAYYATNAASNDEIINGVLNLDMIAWDSDDDGMYEIHASNTANSADLALKAANVNSIYSLTLSPDTYNPGTPYSDHSSFWDQDYGAIMFIEGYYGGDFNPYYHSDDDRISEFNMGYFYELSKLSVGTIATWALGESLPAPLATFNPEDGATGVAVNQALVVSFNTPVRKLDDSEITDPSEFIEFKLASPIGDDVPFSASINADKTEFAITPDEEMSYNQQYYVEISDQIENDDDVQFEGASITFTTLDNTGILEITAKDAQLYPNPATSTISIDFSKEINQSFTIEILDLSGKQVKEYTFAADSQFALDVSTINAGMYMMHIHNDDFSIMKKFSVL